MTATKMTAVKEMKATKMKAKKIKFKQRWFYAPQKKTKAKEQRFTATSIDFSSDCTSAPTRLNRSQLRRRSDRHPKVSLNVGNIGTFWSSDRCMRIAILQKNAMPQFQHARCGNHLEHEQLPWLDLMMRIMLHSVITALETMPRFHHPICYQALH